MGSGPGEWMRREMAMQARGQDGDPPADAPLYRQLVDALRAEIQAGAYPVGGMLPTEAELRSRFGVSRHTVREALRQLRDEGLVASRQGAGTTVLASDPADHFVQEVASINDLITYAAELRYAVDSSAMVIAGADLALRLGCHEGQRWLRIEGYRYTSGADVPVAWSEVYVHADFAGVALHLGRRPGPIHLWIEEMYGQLVQEVEQVLTGRVIPDAVAPALGVEPGHMGIEVLRTYYMASGAAAEVAITIHPAERFTHTTILRRART